VGYGISAPEYHWNDFAGPNGDIDLKGKIALVIVNEPPSSDDRFFKGKALTYYGRWTYKFEEAARRGALGVLLIHRRDLASYGWEVVRNSQAVEKSYLEGDPEATLRAAAWIQHSVAQRLFTLAGLGDLDQAIDRAGHPGFHPVELPVRLRAHIESRVRRYASSNVVGRVAGVSAPDQAILYTAHYDHLGIDPDAKGDNIYNGAADNGTGCGILLEIARAFAQSRQRPPHAVYFASVTAEEQGLLGSQYLSLHPPVPAAHLSLDLNYDMLLPIGIPRSVNLTGAERTSFWPTVESVAKAFDLALPPDANPMAGHYFRSDHFSLARAGIPAFSIDQGELFAGHTADWGHQQQQDYTAHHYHQPSDEFHTDWDFRGNAKLARFGFVLGWLASQQPKPVEWLPGDEFEAARKSSQSAPAQH
jgi:Zn-dependent M28 family amino/carboxypeptidase